MSKQFTMLSLQSRVSLVVAWIREPSRNPLFLQDVPEAALKGMAVEVVDRFLSWVEPGGFVLDLVNNGSPEQPRWAGHWQYRGSSLEGFRQPPDADSEDEARLLACTALLANDWCRARL